jgi:hypothetical protein
MKKIADEKKGESIEKQHMPDTGIISFGNILKRAALGQDLTQGIFQPSIPMIKPVFRFAQLEQSDQEMSSSAKKKKRHSNQK